MGLRLCWVVVCVLSGRLALCGEPESGPVAARFHVTVNLVPDRGQSYGSLFEMRDATGRVIAGAGFQDVYNTRFRSDRHTLQFFVRPRSYGDRFQLERLPHPDLDCGVYLFDWNQHLFAWSTVKNNGLRGWDHSGHMWRARGPLPPRPVRSGDGVIRVGRGTLFFSGNSAYYEGKSILPAPDVGGFYNFYYAEGRLFFYHRHRAESESFTRIYACAWEPDEVGQIAIDKAIVLETPYDQETPFAWGQFRGQVLTVSNQGGVYVFEGAQWRTLLEPNDQVSYQVYSMLPWHDRLLLAQYPTGNIFEYRGRDLTRLNDWPPRLPGVSSHARECQTLGIYRGDLFAGVWPWAELWRYDRDARKWNSLGRMFSHPQLTRERVHPYEMEAEKHGLVTNHWGQRVTGLVPVGDALYVSTSAKGTYRWDPRYDFLDEMQRREYGSVLRLTMPGNLTAQVPWKEGPMDLEFVIRSTQLQIYQGDIRLASSELDEEFRADLRDSSVTWGQGVFGSFGGRLIKHQVRLP